MSTSNDVWADHKWLKEARRWAKHAYCYEQMIDEFIDWFEQAHKMDFDPYDAVDSFATKHDLDRADQNWGINQGVQFNKETWK